MTPEQEKAARSYRKRQAWNKFLADVAVNMERRPSMLLILGAVSAASLLVML